MAITTHLDIVSLEKEIFSGLAELVVVDGSEGEMGIAPGHTALLAELNPGPVRVIKQGGEEEVFYISGGTLEVQPQKIAILADTAERAATLDEAEILAAKRKAEEILSEKKSDFDYSSATKELAFAIAQLKALRKLREKMKR